MKFMTALESQLLSYPRATDESAQKMIKCFDAPVNELLILLIAALENDDPCFINSVINDALLHHCADLQKAFINIANRHNQ